MKEWRIKLSRSTILYVLQCDLCGFVLFWSLSGPNICFGIMPNYYKHLFSKVLTYKALLVQIKVILVPLGRFSLQWSHYYSLTFFQNNTSFGSPISLLKLSVVDGRVSKTWHQEKGQTILSIC